MVSMALDGIEVGAGACFTTTMGGAEAVVDGADGNPGGCIPGDWPCATSTLDKEPYTLVRRPCPS